MNEETIFKRDKTRLSNLLREYRDHMITKHYNQLKHKGIENVIEQIDNAISTINFSM